MKGGRGEDGGGVGKTHEVGGRDGVRVGQRRVREVGVWRRGGMSREMNIVFLKIKMIFLRFFFL